MRAEDSDRARPAEPIHGNGSNHDTKADNQPAPGGKARRTRRRLHPVSIAAAARAGLLFWWQILAVAIPVSVVSSGLDVLINHYVDPAAAPLSLGASLGSLARHHLV